MTVLSHPVVHLLGKYNGVVFDERDVSFCLGEGVEQGISEGIEHAIKKFKKGEKSKLKVSAKHAYGETGCPDKNVPPNADVEYEVTLKTFEKASVCFHLGSSVYLGNIMYIDNLIPRYQIYSLGWAMR